jgi:hypothetical protein
MSSNKEVGIRAHARACMRFYRYFADAERNSSKGFVGRLCYRDMLESMRCCGLIDSYDLKHFTIQIGGVEVDA